MSKFLNPNFRRSKKEMLTLDEMVSGIYSGNISVLSKAITLVESMHPEHRRQARLLLDTLGTPKIQSKRIGITGSPGVGKSSFIEFLIKQKEKEAFAILAIDPSSSESKGSILGDKTRMESLVGRSNVYIRPSPAGKTLGGISAKTKETILLCEHAGFPNIIVETVGVGQSETMVSEMVDVFILLILPGSGDEIQGIKRGIMENADIIVITKNDENRETIVRASIKSYKNALHLFRPKYKGWTIPVIPNSIYALSNAQSVWNEINEFISFSKENGFFEEIRYRQQTIWFEQQIQDLLMQYVLDIPGLQETISKQKLSFSKKETSVFKGIKEIEQFLKIQS